MSAVRPTRSRPLALVLALVLGLALAGCASLPDEGAVQGGEQPSPTGSAAPFDFNPPGPQTGAAPQEIVAGFLRALQATPVSTRVAEEFLTPDAAAGWHPERRTLVYGSQVARSAAAAVRLHLRQAFALDATGRWEGALRRPASTLDLGLVRKDGEWRIDDLPDATIIPVSHFERRYREYSLYFFDSTGSVLVPEPVYLPWGVQAPTQLVSGLLAGPRQGRGAARTSFPAGTRLGVSVPVTPGGTAQVPLTREVLRLGEAQLDRVLAQLSWTLRQTGDVTAMQLLVDGEAVELPGGATSVGVTGYSEYSPAIASASTDLFGVRGQRIVQDVGSQEITAADLPSKGRLTARSLGVGMTGQRFAVVAADGRRVVVLNRADSERPAPVTVYQGSDVLRPMWDRTGRLWLVDRTTSGPRVLTGTPGRLDRLSLPRLDGTPTAAALSRDGTRLVLALERAGSTRLVLLPVGRRPNGRPQGFGPPLALPTRRPLTEVHGLGWRDPATVAVLVRPSNRTSAIELASCDGSSHRVGLEPPVDLLFGRGIGLAASPGGPLALAVSTDVGRTFLLNAQGRWELGSVPDGLRLATYAG